MESEMKGLILIKILMWNVFVSVCVMRDLISMMLIRDRCHKLSVYMYIV